jgi:hypothetical protein
MGMVVRFLFVVGMVMIMDAMLPRMLMPVIIDPARMGVRMCMFVIMLMRMAVLVGVGVGLAVMGVGVLMLMGMLMGVFVLMFVITFHIWTSFSNWGFRKDRSRRQRHPRQIFFPSMLSIFEGMVGSPHRAHGSDGSIRAFPGIAISAGASSNRSPMGLSSRSRLRCR